MLGLDWFEELTGFRENDYLHVKTQLEFGAGTVKSKVNGKIYELGKFELLSLAELRSIKHSLPDRSQNHDHRVVQILETTIQADAYELHSRPDAHGSLVQVASQFNCLEMPSPEVGPEAGVTNYANDHTQGPACAMAAGPATLYRNYGVWIGSQQGQSNSNQINTLDDLISALDVRDFEMRNGYFLISKSGLSDLNKKFIAMSPDRRNELKGLLKVGVQWNTSVTAKGAPYGQKLTQVFCSALPIAYNRDCAPLLWEPFARLVLEACYEATVLAGALNFEKTGNPRVYLTRVGGGVFGNEASWIDRAKELAIEKVAHLPLEIIHVCR